MDKIKPPANLDMEVRDLPKAWKRWKEELKLTMELAMSNKEESVKVKMFQFLIGTKGREVYKALGQTNELKLDEVLQAFDAIPKRMKQWKGTGSLREIKKVGSP